MNDTLQFTHSLSNAPHMLGDQHLELSKLTSPPMLVAMGVLANGFFWGGLLLPFNPNAGAELAYLHIFTALLGLGLAFGGSMATIMTIANKGIVPLRSAEFAACFLNIFVLIAMGSLLLTSFIRGFA